MCILDKFITSTTPIQPQDFQLIFAIFLGFAYLASTLTAHTSYTNLYIVTRTRFSNISPVAKAQFHTPLFIHSFAMFCYVFCASCRVLIEQQVVTVLAHQPGECPKHSTNYHERVDEQRCKFTSFLRGLPPPFRQQTKLCNTRSSVAQRQHRHCGVWPRAALFAMFLLLKTMNSVRTTYALTTRSRSVLSRPRRLLRSSLRRGARRRSRNEDEDGRTDGRGVCVRCPTHSSQLQSSHDSSQIL